MNLTNLRRLYYFFFIFVWLFILSNFLKTVPNFRIEFFSPETVHRGGEKEKNKYFEGSMSMHTQTNYTTGVTEKIIFNGELFPSIVTTEDNGKLGNQMCAYASLMYFQKVHGMHAILADWQIDRLAEVFQQEKFQINATMIKMPPQFNITWDVVATQTPQGAFFPNKEFLENIEEYKYNKFLNIGIWPNYLFLYKEILDDLRKQLVFKPEIQTLVYQMLANITIEKYYYYSGKEIVFIGVHCRRGDYAHQLMKQSGGSLVDERYFDRAFDIYRSRYNKPTIQVIFVVVSDDTAWIKENLGKHEDVKFGLDASQGKVEDTDLPGFDLCLLSACNHSIHDYGTFGTWGALLAGGDVIATRGTNQDANSEEDQIWQRAAMDGWVYLDVRDLDNIREVTYS